MRENPPMLKRLYILFILLFSFTSAAQETTSIDNLVVFTKLVGYIRYFHPSDVAAETDWDEFTMAHIETVEAAKTPEELVKILSTLFAPYTPTVQIYMDDHAPVFNIKPPEDVDRLYVVQWLHTPIYGEPDGFVPAPTLMRQQVIEGEISDFIFESEVYGTISIPFNSPDEPYVAKLGQGISASIPLSLYADNTGTLPHMSRPPQIRLPFFPVVTNRSTRLAVIIKTWNHFQHFYPYWDIIHQVDWERALVDALIEADQAEPGTFYDTMLRLTAPLQDNQLYINPANEVASQRRMLFTNHLPFWWDMIEEKLVITSILLNAPDELHTGDIITAIDGRPITEILEEESTFTSKTGQHATFDILLYETFGNPSSSVDLTVQPFDGKQTFTITVDRVYREADDALIYLREARPDNALTYLTPDVIYADLSRLTEANYSLVMDALSKADKIVFDMRGFRPDWLPYWILAHLTDTPLRCPPFLIPYVTTPDHQDIQFVDSSTVWVQPQQPSITDDVVFITNANGGYVLTDIFAAMVNKYNIGTLVGSPTAGISGYFTSIPLPGDFIIYWTGYRINDFDGSPLFAVGIEPDILVERTIEGVAAGRDELLEAAVSYLTGQPFDSSTLRQQY